MRATKLRPHPEGGASLSAGRGLKVLAISHSCVVDVNQQLYVALSRLPDVAGVELIVPSQWRSEYTKGRFAPRLLAAVDFPVHRLPVALPGHTVLHFYLRLPLARLRRFQPDVVFSFQEPWSLSGLQAVWLSKRLGVPLVFFSNQNIQKRYPPPFSSIERLSYRAAAAALAPSQEACQVMLRKGLRKPALVLPYGTDLSRFTRESGERDSLRKQLNLDGAIVLGYMGRFVPEKGLDTLVQAVAQICRQERAPQSIKVLLVGGGPGEADLRRAIDEAGLSRRFVFAGSVAHTQAGAYLRCMDIFVLPSRTTRRWKEQFGRVLIEALACGVPVVGSDSGQIPHLIEDTGGGVVFGEDDAADLAEKLLALIRDPARRSRLAARGEAAVRERYSCEAVAGRLHAILRKAVAGTGRAPETGAA